MNRRLVALAAAFVLMVSMAPPGLAGVRAPDGAAAPAPAMPAGPTDETKVPHYFGPYPNWANSPLTAPTATVTISGDGTGATASATVGANGAVTGITILTPGSGYTAATVVIAGTNTTPATADAVITTSGAVTAVTIGNPGGGYLHPVVAFTGGAPDATGTVFGGVDALVLDAPGSGYHVPTVAFDLPDDPNGTVPTAHVTCQELNCSNPNPDGTPGVVTILAIVLDTPGSGYANAPGVSILDGTQFDPIRPGGTGALVSSTLLVQSVTLDTFGSGYLGTPGVAITDSLGGTGTGALASATTSAGTVTGIANLVGGAGYISAGGIKKFTDPLPGLCLPPACPTTGKYIPMGVPEAVTYNGVAADQYEIALIQYHTSFSTSLPPTLVRGYVQLETAANVGVSQHFPLVNELMDGSTVPVLVNSVQALGVTPPQWLGPTLVASKDKPVRIIFRNLLPTGTAGDLFLPTDSSMMGSGMTPMAMPAPVDSGSVMDEVRNPMCTEYPKAANCFKDNRATLHLHGGTTPWISDGTAHQWITPAGETTAWPQGVSVQNVPDMSAAGCDAATDGCQTFFYTNQQSARLLFYHDHAWGITRLNVYAGEAAGYLITDPTEQKLIGTGGALAGLSYGTPLVIQDRTFVPSPAQIAQQDPTWDSARWGGEGSLWYHHVYMPAQNPGDPSGMSAYGRWMYGPWFWPPASPPYGPIANPYYNMDPATGFTTPLAVPCNLDDPNTWQYPVDPFCEPAQIPGTPNISVGMEQFNDTPIVNGTAYPTVNVDPQSYRYRILNAANDRFWNLQWYLADNQTPGLDTEVALKATELAAAQTDINVFPTPDTNLSPVGPSWIQIGSEGGFLPAPTVVPNQPITWITDPTRFDVGNVDKHSLLLAPAERADVIVDFSKFAGKTLILYNDAPAAFPARVASYDYYTGGPDTGAGVVLPGYGPNTRTIMQVKVSGTVGVNGTPFNLTALKNAFLHKANGTGVFEESQHPIIVGQAAYNSAYGTNFAAGAWCNDPKATGTATTRCDGLARIQEGNHPTDLFGFNTLKSGLTSKLQIPFQPKGLHDEMNSASFDEFGRMTANLGLEAPNANPLLQNIILYPFVNPGTEFIDGTKLPAADVTVAPISSATDGTQIWKITHNGVDTHPIHFHLFDVQVINRVTWDNIIIPTEPSELGWKDTVRISPLEDTIVALRPVVPQVPFEVPNSIRPLNPMMPLGDTSMFNPVDINGNPTPDVINAMVNFGWEYVYHCHILSHEEMDMMRPVTLALPPIAADGLAFDKPTHTLTWNDNSINETSFLVQRSTDGGTTWADVGTDPSPFDVANTHGIRTFVDSTYDPYTDYQYQVVALNTVGYGGDFPSMTVKSTSSAVIVLNPPKAPSALTGVLAFGPQITLSWTDNATNETGFAIERQLNGGPFVQVGTVAANVTTFVDTVANGLAPAATFGYRVIATNAIGPSLPSNVFTQVIPAPPAAPTNLTATLQALPAGPGPVAQVTLTFRDNANNETGFIVERSTNGAAFTALATLPPRTNGNSTVTYVDTTAAAGATPTTYAYRVTARGLFVQSAYTSTVSVVVPTLPATPTAFTAAQGPNGNGNSRSINLTFAGNNTANVTGFTIQRATNAAFTGSTTTNVAATATTLSVTGLSRNTTYFFRIRANNGSIVATTWFASTPASLTTLP